MRVVLVKEAECKQASRREDDPVATPQLQEEELDTPDDQIGLGDFFGFSAFSDWAAKDRDPGLTEHGTRQSRHLGAKFTKQYMQSALGLPTLPDAMRVFCSPMLASLQTASPLAETLGVPLRARPELAEVDTSRADEEQREAAGMSPEDIVTKFPACDVSALPSSGPWDAALHVEAPRQAMERVEYLAQWLGSPELAGELASQQGTAVCVVVCPEHLHDLLLRRLLGTMSALATLATSTSAFRMAQTKGSAKVECQWINRVDHLYIKLGMDLGLMRAAERPDPRKRSRL